MTVKRIVANIATAEPGLAQAFYGEIFGGLFNVLSEGD